MWWTGKGLAGMSENWCALCAAKDQEIADLKRKTQAAEAQLLELRNTATEATEAWNSSERSCEQKDAEIADLKRQLEEARTPKWSCFHCGFETTNKSYAEAHFGEDSDEVAICVHWSDKTANEKLYEFQDIIKELNAERDYSAKLQTELEEARKATSKLDEYGGPEEAYAELESIRTKLFPEYEGEDSLSTLVIQAAQQLESARKDTERLNWLERRRLALNAYYGTKYGWKFIASSNVTRLFVCDVNTIDLSDAAANYGNIRGAIDAAREGK